MIEVIKSSSWQKKTLNVLFILGIIYGIFILRYFLYVIIQPEPLSYFLQNSFYFNPLINKITFLLHVAGGTTALILSPFVMISYKKNWPSFTTFAYLYILSWAFIIVFFPLIAFVQSTGFSVGFFIFFAIEAISLYMMLRGFYYLIKQDYPSFMIFFIYLFGFLLSTAIFRPISLFLTNYIFTETSHLYEARIYRIVFDPNNLAFELATFITLVLSILIPKILMYIKVLNKY